MIHSLTVTFKKNTIYLGRSVCILCDRLLILHSLDVTGPFLETPSYHCIKLQGNSCADSHFDNLLATGGKVSIAYYCLLRTVSANIFAEDTTFSAYNTEIKNIFYPAGKNIYKCFFSLINPGKNESMYIKIKY